MNERSKELTQKTGLDDFSESEDSDLDVTSESEASAESDLDMNEATDDDDGGEAPTKSQSLLWWKEVSLFP